MNKFLTSSFLWFCGWSLNYILHLPVYTASKLSPTLVPNISVIAWPKYLEIMKKIGWHGVNQKMYNTYFLHISQSEQFFLPASQKVFATPILSLSWHKEYLIPSTLSAGPRYSFNYFKSTHGTYQSAFLLIALLVLCQYNQ